MLSQSQLSRDRPQAQGNSTAKNINNSQVFQKWVQGSCAGGTTPQAKNPDVIVKRGKSKQNQRVESLALQNIVFSACSNTIKKIEKKSGSKVVLLEGVERVTAGVARIIELQEEGYSYIRP